ncbi:TetR/AcrR family transcriptional regulator [Nocardia nova]|uniref:TetR/AcrR family transcriptional regulator n=1 Tax=Nocardia nova TaxID=37330 RepID=UPI0033D52E6E
MSAAQREQQLLDTAEALFTRRGYEGVTLDDIARAAGVSRPIVYQHHGSKDGIFLACVRRAREQFERGIVDSVASADNDMVSMLRAGSTPYFDLIATDPHRWALLFTTSASLSGELADRLIELRADTIHHVADLIRPFVDPLPEQEVVAFAYAVSGISEQLGRWWLQNPTVSREYVLDLSCTLVLGAREAMLQSHAAAAAARTSTA